MAYPFFTLLASGYSIDPLALLRIALSIGAIYYYTMFCRHKDAKLYQCSLKRMTFVFFFIESGAEFLAAALGNTSIFTVLTSFGRLGVAFTVFQVSQRVVASEYAPLVVPLVFAGIVQVAGISIDVISMTSIVLIMLTIRNYATYYKTQNISAGTPYLARSFFLLSLLSYYVFLLTGTLLGVDMSSAGELAILLAVALGFYSAMAATKISEI